MISTKNVCFTFKKDLSTLNYVCIYMYNLEFILFNSNANNLVNITVL